MYDPRELMQLAIEKTREGIVTGQSPFGCAIALGDQLLAVSHNIVWATTDITAHAEVTALREACRKSGQILLTGAIVATTTEPCPMCMAALHWARVGEVHFGASVADAAEAGFNEIPLAAHEMVARAGGQPKLYAGVMAAECRELFRTWKNSRNPRSY